MTLVWSTTTDQLYAVGNRSPSLDLDFATSKTLDDRVSGLPLVDHQRDMSGANASPGTYVGSDKLIKTSPVNLKTYSNDFSQGWSQIGSSILSSNNTDAFGGNTATRLDLPVANGRLQINSTGVTGMNTFSVYMRHVSGDDQIRLLLQTTSGAGTGDTVTVTSEWQRFSTTQDVVSGGGIQIRNTSSASVIEVFAVQLEEGSTATTYIPTTSVISGAPRFDHDPVTGESLGLLIEEESPTAEETTAYEAAVAIYKAASTVENQAEIDAAEAQNAKANGIKTLLNELTAAERVSLDDQRVTNGLALLVSRELLGAERPAEIVAYDRPFPVSEAPVGGGE